MNTPNPNLPSEAGRAAGHAGGAKIYDRPGPLALASRPLSLILVALLALVAASFVYYKYYSA